MMHWRNIVSMVLLSVYFIVLGHNFMPHHHHQKSFTDQCCRDISLQQPTEFHLEICAEGTCHHENEKHSPCHFEVDPVPSKVFFLDTAVLIAAFVWEIDFPDEEPIQWPEVQIEIPKSRSGPVQPLRGPPVIA